MSVLATILMLTAGTAAIARLVYTIYWIFTEKLDYRNDATEWHPTGGISDSMRRLRPDGTWEYRPMTPKEDKDAWVEAQW